MATQKIVSRWNSESVLFECDLPKGIASGLAMLHALEKAVEAKTYLRGAYLSCADLGGAYLSDAYLSGAYLSCAYLGGAYLSDAYLSGAYLSCADLGGAYLSGAERASDEQAIANLDKVREIILDDKKRLKMDHWHAPESNWRDKICAEEMLCGTTHCLAGWLQVCSTDQKIREMDTQTAGVIQAPIAAKMFFRQVDEVLSWLDERKYVAEIEEGNRRAAGHKAKQEVQEQS